MLAIRPGYNAEYVLGHLTAAENTAANLLGGSRVTTDRYSGWVNDALRTLGPALSAEELNRLITTPFYWAIIGALSAKSATENTLLALIESELTRQQQLISHVRDELAREIQRWVTRKAVMAVVDTNVLLLHSSELETFDWHGTLNERTNVPLVIWIPIAVVDELDNLKRNAGDMTIRGVRVPRRTLARQALRALDEAFPDPFYSFALDGVGGPSHQAELRLLMDDEAHQRLERPDAEIIDRALSLSALSERTSLITYDLGMSFAARAAGLRTVLLRDSSD